MPRPSSLAVSLHSDLTMGDVDFLSDEASTSDEESMAGEESSFAAPEKGTAVSLATKDTYDSSFSSEEEKSKLKALLDEEDDDDSDEEPVDVDNLDVISLVGDDPVPTSTRRASRRPGREGVQSDDECAPARTTRRGRRRDIGLAETRLKDANERSVIRRKSLDTVEMNMVASQQRLKSLQFEDEDFQPFQRTGFNQDLKNQEGDFKKAIMQKRLLAKQEARRLRMLKVKERIAREKEEEERRLREQREREKAKQEVDMSEEARRERAYNWYVRTAMPTKKNFIKRIEKMPSSAGIVVEDVELLPWDFSGTRVNVSKMNAVLRDSLHSSKHKK